MSIPEILYQRAIQAGFTIEGACSLLAQIQAESAFRADNAEDRINGSVSDAEYVRRADAGLETYNGRNFIYDAVGFGYAQWTFWSRKKGLLEFCKGRSASVADHESQKEFIFYEMERDFPAIWNLCRTSHDLKYITEQLISVWENPANHGAAFAERYPYAQAWLSKFNNWTSPSEMTQGGEAGAVKDAENTWPPRTIDKNCSGWKEVRLLQTLLWCHGYNVLTDGIFSDSLSKKVKEFQDKSGLNGDGICGPKTWKLLLTLPVNF